LKLLESRKGKGVEKEEKSFATEDFEAITRDG